MKKILYISNIADKIGNFSMASIFAAKKCGYKFYFAANWNGASIEQRKADEDKYGITLVHVDLARSPYSLKNYKAYKQIVDLINNEGIDYIHCNTPIGGVLGRLTGNKCKVKKVLYQVHGFHFYKGAPKKNWLIYYPIERLLASKTDSIVTINKEDFERARVWKLKKNGKVYYVPGVGIDLLQFEYNDDKREETRTKFGINKDEFVILAVGRLEKNKNCETIINAFKQINQKQCKLLFCGDGKDRKKLEDLVKGLDCTNSIIFLGNRTDMKAIYSCADCFVLASFREGLSRSIMEAMASGLPCVVSKIRGNVDLLDGAGGFLCNPHNEREFSEAFLKLIDNEEDRSNMGRYNMEKIKQFGLMNVTERISSIYMECFNGESI